ncbi:hypothetical protein I5L51_04780 [Pseudomonas mendocina]|nr:hypothetical protein [Pseudomonas mendocina]MBH3338422.1 hypothetical protein [Pseudomonas mendocina]
MTTYIIALEYSSPSILVKNKVAEIIKSYSGWARITENTWAITTSDEVKAATIRDSIAKVAGEKDRIFVVKSGVAAAWRNSRCKNEWLKKHL